MKIGMLQLNLTVGDVAGNAKKILEGYRELCRQGAELVVTSELALLGYPIKDLIFNDEIIDEQNRELDLIRSDVGDVGLIIGVAERAEGCGKPFCNSAYFLHNREVIFIQQKYLLPMYDVFDEARYFEPNPGITPTLIKYKGKRIAILICEDIWGNDEMANGLYEYDPIVALKKVYPDLLVTLNASPYYLGKEIVREKLIENISSDLGCPVVYVNQIGGNDELVFDGRSCVSDRKKSSIAYAPAFSESKMIVDVDLLRKIDIPCNNPDKNLLDTLVLGTRDYVRKSGFTKAVIALSGGIDSAVTAAIACLALGPENVMGVALPSQFSSQGSIDDAELLAKNLGIRFHTISISGIYDAFGDALKKEINWYIPGTIPGDATEENVQARTRGAIMMAISNRLGAILLTTGNKSEVSVGYCTLYGDMAGGFAVISDLYKGKVYKLANFINREKEIIPYNTINKAPSAELRPDQKDEDSLPPYDVLDEILEAYIEKGWSIKRIIDTRLLDKESREFTRKIADEETVRKIINMVNRSEYKRQQMPPGLKVTKKAFGSGRRMPIAAKY